MAETEHPELRKAGKRGRLVVALFTILPVLLTALAAFIVYTTSEKTHKSFEAGKTFYAVEVRGGVKIALDAAGRPLTLVTEGGLQPEGFPPSRTARVPVRRAVVGSGDFDIGIMESLGMADSVVGVCVKKGELLSPELSKRYEEGLLAYVGDSTALNYELIQSLEPDLVLCPNLRCAEIVEETGIPSSIAYSPLDNSLKARMRFVEYLAAFGGKESLAGSFIDRSESAMERLREKGAGLPRVKVMWAVIFEKRVFAEPGENWVGEIVRGLGADYVFADVKGASTEEVSLEHFVEKGRSADVLILYPTAGQLEGGKETVIRKNPAVSPIKPLGPDGRTYATLPLFYESFGNLTEIMEELFMILHPELYPEQRNFKYFQELH
ncbi:MAG: ABC transporter substrate-binding protein [Deltaproteobacteria bacterium]|jgi:iron complex transport system substrate-binding protein|nr:ABC transporter substrate-binding protein [Deltaproteobacteria bacterium]